MSADQHQLHKINSIRLASDLMSPGLIAIFEASQQEAAKSVEAAKAFLEKATDVECLAVMSEVSLTAPLNDIGYKLMMHLSFKAFSAAGIENIPDFILQARELDRYHQDHLERLQRDIRHKQFSKTRLKTKHLEL